MFVAGRPEWISSRWKPPRKWFSTATLISREGAQSSRVMFQCVKSIARGFTHAEVIVGLWCSRNYPYFFFFFFFNSGPVSAAEVVSVLADGHTDSCLWPQVWSWSCKKHVQQADKSASEFMNCLGYKNFCAISDTKGYETNEQQSRR